jgi:UDP-N-acetylmuramyl pentapeptide phosphotransferase/UDP-N-acetylglucosamine-1-phosphate transferase
MHSNAYLIYFLGSGATVFCAVLARYFLYPMLLMCPYLQRFNYRQENVPIAAGIIFVLAAMPVHAVFSIYQPQNRTMWLIWMACILLCTLLGFLDDIAGNREDSGLKGHLRALLKEGRLTTGGLKASGGIIIAIYVAALSTSNLIDFFLGVAAVALSINIINIFDLRPGRAGKFFFVFLALIFILAFFSLEIFRYIFPIALALMVYFPLDVKAKTMMGDTGANALGLCLGLTSVWYLTTYSLLVYVIIIFGIHVIAEKSSLTRIIEKVTLLRKFDQLGR